MGFKFANVLGKFYFDDKLNPVKKANKDNVEIPEKKINQILQFFRKSEFHEKFYLKNLQLTKQQLKESVSKDQLIIQTISNINEIDRVVNILVKRLREWYSLYYPELDEKIDSHEQFVESVLSGKKKENDSMGADLEKVHLTQINELAKQVRLMFNLRKKHEDYLQKVMSGYCPNILELAGTTIGAKLIELARSLKRMALLPASTIQLLGAEKALFRHIKTGSRSPKHGIIISHPIVQSAKRDKRGKAARMLADKLSLCARLDYFKGEMKAKEYRKELEEKLK